MSAVQQGEGASVLSPETTQPSGPIPYDKDLIASQLLCGPIPYQWEFVSAAACPHWGHETWRFGWHFPHPPVNGPLCIEHQDWTS